MLPEEARIRLADIYRRVHEEVASAGPVCRQSGNCCNFPEADHDLYASTIEIAYLVQAHALQTDTGKSLCPYWLERKCTAREGRPLGCRVYFCDKDYQRDHSQAIYEKYHREIRELANEFEIEYRYVPLVRMLEARNAL